MQLTPEQVKGRNKNVAKENKAVAEKCVFRISDRLGLARNNSSRQGLSG